MCILWAYWSCQIVGGVRNSDGCRFEPNIARTDDRFRRAAIGLRMWHVLGVVEPGNIRRARDTSDSRAPFHFWPSAVALPLGAICLLAAPSVATGLFLGLKMW